MNIPKSIKNADRETLEKLAWGWYKEVCEYERKANCKLVDRIEVIEKNGRGYINYLDEDQFAWLSYQDGGRTLKVFIDEYQDELVVQLVLDLCEAQLVYKEWWDGIKNTDGIL